MNYFLKRLLIGLFLIAVGLFCYSYFVENIFSQRLSPQDSVSFQMNDLKLEVKYNRPSKREREVFGALVPYNEVWRTGANEATVFITNQDLMIDGIFLPQGSYTLWTVPNEEHWQVFFNNKMYPWGVNEAMEAMREPQFDIVDIHVPVSHLDNEVEQFTIGFDNTTGNIFLTMAWDTTKIAIPIEVLKLTQ